MHHESCFVCQNTERSDPNARPRSYGCVAYRRIMYGDLRSVEKTLAESDHVLYVAVKEGEAVDAVVCTLDSPGKSGIQSNAGRV